MEEWRGLAAGQVAGAPTSGGVWLKRCRSLLRSVFRGLFHTWRVSVWRRSAISCPPGSRLWGFLWRWSCFTGPGMLRFRTRVQ